MTAELIDSQLALNFLKCPERIKTNFYRPTTIIVLQFYVKELLWKRRSLGALNEFGAQSASGEQEEVALSHYEEAAEDKRWRGFIAAGGS